MPPKVIFIGHSLGGLVIKQVGLSIMLSSGGSNDHCQALLNAKEDPKYNSIRTSTSGLVFFGTPHRGAKAVELGKIAARVARFVSKGGASNDLLDCLEHNSLFTRQMSDRFRHQLEDYRVVSFIEGKEVQLGGIGPASVSHVRELGSRSPILNANFCSWWWMRSRLSLVYPVSVKHNSS